MSQLFGGDYYTIGYFMLLEWVTPVTADTIVLPRCLRLSLALVFSIPDTDAQYPNQTTD